MSHLGNGSSYLTGSSVPVTALEGKTLIVAYKPSSLTDNEGIVGFRDSVTGSYYSLHFQGSATNDPIQLRRFHAGNVSTTASGPVLTMSTSTWYFIMVVFAAAGNGVTVYVNNVAGTTDTTSVSPPAWDVFEVFETLGASESADRIGELGIYDAEKVSADHTSIFNGTNPQDLSDLTHYWDMENNLTPVVGSTTFTATGTIAQDADHPTVNAPSGGGSSLTAGSFSLLGVGI